MNIEISSVIQDSYFAVAATTSVAIVITFFYIFLFNSLKNTWWLNTKKNLKRKHRRKKVSHAQCARQYEFRARFFYFSRKSAKEKKISLVDLKMSVLTLPARCKCCASVKLKPHIIQQQCSKCYFYFLKWLNSMVTCWICVTFMFAIVLVEYISKSCMHTYPYVCICN